MIHLRVLAALGTCAALLAQTPSPAPRLLSRRYTEGEKVEYRMKATNDNWRYEARASGVVKKDAKGIFFEELSWSDLISDGKPYALPQTNAGFRQVLSLDTRKPPSVPKLAGADPKLIGPITDLLTFYADLWLASVMANLKNPGDHRYQPIASVNSWADGSRVILGEDTIDFDITLKEIDDAHKIATLQVRHVPPEKSRMKLPAAWMEAPVGDRPNNWVEVQHKGDKYIAAAGQETYDVLLKVNLADGRILSGTMENPVQTIERECQDAALNSCGDPHARRILRNIAIAAF